MKLSRLPLIAALAAAAVLAVGAPAANASTVLAYPFSLPTTALTTVIGPTIISPGFAGSSIVSGGNVAIGP